MTPQEKAKELVSAYARIDGYVDSIDLSKCEFEKKCALITVDEIIQISDINKIVYSFYDDNCLSQYTEDFYWKKVKQEIERL